MSTASKIDENQERTTSPTKLHIAIRSDLGKYISLVVTLTLEPISYSNLRGIAGKALQIEIDLGSKLSKDLKKHEESPSDTSWSACAHCCSSLLLSRDRLRLQDLCALGLVTANPEQIVPSEGTQNFDRPSVTPYLRTFVGEDEARIELATICAQLQRLKERNLS